MNEKDLQIIKNSTLFQGLSWDELSEALKALNARKRSFKKDELLLSAGDLTDDLGMVLSGSVIIESNDIWGNRTIINHAAAGDYYAEAFSIMPDEHLYVDVRANEPTVVALFDMSQLQNLRNTHPAWVVKLFSNLLTISIRKNMILSKRSFHTSPKSVRGRVMSYLNSVAVKTHKREFDIPFDRQHMADYLNLDRSALSKELSKMRDDGLIVYHKNHFKILSIDGIDSDV